jgi:serine/threonine-protein kinase RsbW
VTGNVVEIRVPADSSYVALLRTATATLAARADFTLDEIDDLRIAIDEACALLLPNAADDAMIDCRFTVADDSLEIAVTAATRNLTKPDPTSFAWMVLNALAGEVDVRNGGDHETTIGLRKVRSTSS